jgi:hypothetical protein
MNKDSALAFLRALGARQVTVQSPTTIVASCPLAPWEHASGKDAHPSFAVIINPRKETHYNCFTCGGGDLIDLVRKLAKHGAAMPRYDLKTALKIAVSAEEEDITFHVKEWGEPEEPWVTFPELWLSTFARAENHARSLDYLRKRGLPRGVIRALDLRYDDDRDTICFPIRDFEGNLCGLRGRRIEPRDDQPRYHVYKTGEKKHNRAVWYGEGWLDFDKPVIMCESVFDVASVFRVYQNVCAPMSASFSEERAKRMAGAVEVITLFDADKAGDQARGRVRKYLPKAYVTDVHLPDGFKDPGEMDAETLGELLSQHVKVKSLAA